MPLETHYINKNIKIFVKYCVSIYLKKMNHTSTYFTTILAYLMQNEVPVTLDSFQIFERASKMDIPGKLHSLSILYKCSLSKVTQLW